MGSPEQVDASGSKAVLFLSYGRRDAAPLADRLHRDLKDEYEIWQDTRRIRAGREWEEQIKHGLRRTGVVIAVLSPHSVRVSSQPDSPDALDSVCLDEISFARFWPPPTPIVPVMAEPCEPPLCIFRLDYVDMCGWPDCGEVYAAGLDRLKKDLAAALRGEPPRWRAWDHNLRPLDFAEFLERKRADFEGREWLFEEIDAWRNVARERALLITGDPGTGKSAIVAQLMHCNPAGQVLAYHCCTDDDEETLRPSRFVRSIAAMIASKLPDYAARLDDPEVATALDESEANPEGALRRGVIGPLSRLARRGDGVRYILVDALDEGLRRRGSGTTIDRVLASCVEYLPDWIRIVATTRKEPEVLRRLGRLRAKELNAQDPRNVEDVQRYVDRRLAEPDLSVRLEREGLSSAEASRLIIAKSAGNFLYVQQALEGVERDRYSLRQLEEFPPGLHGLYFTFFERRFPDEASFAAARPVLDVAVAAQEPLGADELAAATGLDAEGELPRVLRELAVFLPERRGEGARYGLYHQSLADWLTAPDRRGEPFTASRKRGEELLAKWCWRQYHDGSAARTDYATRHALLHLAQARMNVERGQLEENPRFLEARRALGLSTRIFLSYAQADADFGARLKEDLVAAGYHVWDGAREVRPGASWVAEIEGAIGEADTLIYLMSPASTSSSSICRDEIAYAVNRGVSILPVMIADCRAPLLVSRREWVEMRYDYREGLPRLLQSLGWSASSRPEPVATLVPLDFSQELASDRLAHARRFMIERPQLINEFEAWLADDRSPGLLITGVGGSGKTTLMTHLADTRAEAVAIHFYRASQGPVNATRFVSSIAAQLAASFESYRVQVENLDIGGILEGDSGKGFERLINEPLRRVDPPSAPAVIFVDGIDEMWLSADLSIPTLLARYAMRLPSWIRLVITTRGFDPILRMFESYNRLDLDRQRTRGDLEKMIDARPDLARADREEVIESIQELSQGNILAANLVLANLERVGVTQIRGRLREQPISLADVLLRDFERRFPDPDLYAAGPRPILGALCTEVSMEEETLARAIDRPVAEVREQLTGLGGLVIRKRGRVSLFHRLLGDWLVDESRSQRFFCPTQEHG